MFTQIDFGKRLRNFRKRINLTQKEVAAKISVSEQTLSKWENEDCLPDVYHLKLLAHVFNVSVDCLLDTENESTEKVVETIKVGGAVFEIVEKPAAILAGKIIYAKNFPDIPSFHSAIEDVVNNGEEIVYESITDTVLPINDIHLSVNFWRSEEFHAFGFVREVLTDRQPVGIDVYKIPAALYIRAYTDKFSAQLMSKEECEIWELFAYIRNYFMPSYGFRMAENGAQELEIFDTFEHKSGYAYMPVMPY